MEHFANAPTAPFSSVSDSGENAVGTGRDQGMEGERVRKGGRQGGGKGAGRGERIKFKRLGLYLVEV